MKKLIVTFSILLLIVFSACKGKESCEVNKTGTIKITNKNSIAVDVYVNGTKIANIAPSESVTVAKPVGTYVVKTVNSLDYKDFEVKVTQCGTNEVSAEF